MKISTPVLIAMAFLLAGSAGDCRKPSPGAAAEAAAAKPEEKSQSDTVTLTPEAIAGGGIAVEAARLMPAARLIAAPGEMEFNQRRLAHLTARSAGRVERVAAYAGDRVEAGQVLAEIYSPDYLALQAELLQSADRAQRLKGDPEGEAARRFFESAGRKMLPLGLSQTDVDALAADRTVRPFLAVRAPFTGRVVESSAIPGEHVEMGASLFKLADPSSLWACVHIYEKDLAAVRPGAEARLKTQAYPGQIFNGRLILLGAVMDEKTRTVEGRVEVPNPADRLKPGMFVESTLTAGEKREALFIPEAAVQEYQNKMIVFVQSGPGKFTLRPVETGDRIPGFVEIVKGLAEGEKVATAGSFLLKSEMLKKSLED